METETRKDLIIQKLEELVQNFKDWCKVKSIHEEDTAIEIAKRAVKLESELAALKSESKEGKEQPTRLDEIKLDSKGGFSEDEMYVDFSKV